MKYIAGIIILILVLIILFGNQREDRDTLTELEKKEEGITTYVPKNVTELNIQGITRTKLDLEIKIKNVTQTESYQTPNRIQNAKRGKKYLLFEIEITNKNNPSIRTGAYPMNLIDNFDKRHIAGLYFGKEDLPFSTEIQPNETIRGIVLFVVAKEVEEYRIEYDDTFE